MEMIVPKGCDNAPRKQIVIDFAAALLQKREDVIEEYADASIVWHRLKENETVNGMDSLLAASQAEKELGVACLEVEGVITHGKFASINGVLTLADGSEVDFCDIYTFSSAAKSGKVKRVKSYRL